MKHLLTAVSSIAMAAVVLLTSGCFREIEERIDVVDQEITEIDSTLAVMDATITSLSTIYATIKNFDALKGYTEAIRGDLDKLQNAFDSFKELADQSYATIDQVNSIKNLAIGINNDLAELTQIVYAHGTDITAGKEEIEALKTALAQIEENSLKFATLEEVAEIKAGFSEINASLEKILADMAASGETVAALDLKVIGLEEALGKAEDNLAELAKLVYFITMEIVPEAVVEGSPAVLFHSGEKGANVSVTLEVTPSARAKELQGHIAFNIVPVTTFTRAAEVTVIKGETYSLSGNLLTVTAELPEKAPFIDPEYKLWNVEQAFVISAKYIDNDGLVQLSTPYMSAFLTSAGGTIPKTVAMILGEKNAFWESVAKGATEAAGLEDMTVEVTYCSSQKEQAAAIQNLYSGSKKTKGLIIYPINDQVEKFTATAQEDLNIPVVVVGDKLAKDSPLAEVCKTQVIPNDTTAIKKLDLYMANDGHEKVIIVGLEDSESSQARIDAAKKYLPDTITPTVFMTTAEKAADQISFTIDLIKGTAVMLLDDELIIPGIIAVTKDVKAYAYGSTSIVKTGVADGSINVGMFKDGQKFGAKGFDALFNAAPDPCIVEAETILPDPVAED